MLVRHPPPGSRDPAESRIRKSRKGTLPQELTLTFFLLRHVGHCNSAVRWWFFGKTKTRENGVHLPQGSGEHSKKYSTFWIKFHHVSPLFHAEKNRPLSFFGDPSAMQYLDFASFISLHPSSWMFQNVQGSPYLLTLAPCRLRRQL